MPTAKIAITLDEDYLKEVDRWVKNGQYPSRSRAIQEAVKDKVTKWRENRLARELSKLAPRDWGEQAAYFADPDGNVIVAARPLRTTDG